MLPNHSNFFDVNITATINKEISLTEKKKISTQQGLALQDRILDCGVVSQSVMTGHRSHQGYVIDLSMFLGNIVGTRKGLQSIEARL